MKKVRLTESDLIRLIKRIIKEDQTQQNTNVIKITGPCKAMRAELDDYGTDEQAFVSAVKSINQSNYADTLKCLQNWSQENEEKPFSLISCYVAEEMDYCETKGAYGDSNESKMIEDMDRHLESISGGKDTLLKLGSGGQASCTFFDSKRRQNCKRY